MNAPKMNVNAPIFVPGKTWKANDSTDQSLPERPLIVYGDLDRYGRSMSNPSATARLEFGCDKVQFIVDMHQATTRRVDNTARAVRAREIFDYYIGDNIDNLQAWQDLCFFCGRSPDSMPKTIPGCTKWLKDIHVNIFDLVDAIAAYKVAEPRFKNPRDLERYSRQTGKICPMASGNGNDIYRFMLRRWF